MSYSLHSETGEYIVRLPGAFILDCLECGCDVGMYGNNGVWVGNQKHLEELISRARFYADNGTDYKPMETAAKRLLKAMSREGLWGSL